MKRKDVFVKIVISDPDFFKKFHINASLHQGGKKCVAASRTITSLNKQILK